MWNEQEAEKKEKVIANYQINEQQSFKPDIKLSNDLSDYGLRIPRGRAEWETRTGWEGGNQKVKMKTQEIAVCCGEFLLSFVRFFFIWLMTPNIATSWKSFSHVSRIFHMNGMEKRPDSAVEVGKSEQNDKGKFAFAIFPPLPPQSVCVWAETLMMMRISENFRVERVKSSRSVICFAECSKLEQLR